MKKIDTIILHYKKIDKNTIEVSKDHLEMAIRKIVFTPEFMEEAKLHVLRMLEEQVK